MVLLPMLLFALAAAVSVWAIVRASRTIMHVNQEQSALADDAVAAELRDLVARKELLMQAMQSTRLDFETGKIAQTDRDASLRRLEAETVTVMKRMDAIRGTDDDLKAAMDELNELAPLVAGAGDGEEWSAAALARHGGRRPDAAGAATSSAAPAPAPTTALALVLAAAGLAGWLMLPAPAVAQPAPADEHAGHDHDEPAAAPDAQANTGEGSSTITEGSGALERPDAPVVDATVVVTRIQDGQPVPVADADVRVHVVDPPMELVESRTGRTDATGRALFRIPVRPAAELTAELRGDARLFSDPVSLGQAGAVELPIQLLAQSDDPSTVFVSRLITVLQPNERFLTVQQVFNFANDADAVYEGDPERVETLLRIELPEGAKGIRVLQPGPDRAREVEGVVYLASTVHPAGDAPSRQPGLIVQYSLKHDNQSRYEFDQRLSLPVRNSSFVVPQGSDYERHRVMPIRLETTMCDGQRTEGRMCFSEITDDPEGVPLNQGVQVLVARGGTGEVGDRMVVLTEGWPSSFPLRQVLAILAAVLAAAAAGWLMWLTRSTTGGVPRTSMELQARLDALRVEARELHAAWSRGDLLRSEYERRRAWLAEQMATTLRRLREADPAGRSTADAGAADTHGPAVSAGDSVHAQDGNRAFDPSGDGAQPSADDSAADRD